MFDQTADAAAFFILRQPSSPNAPRPPANSGSAAGRGVWESSLLVRAMSPLPTAVLTHTSNTFASVPLIKNARVPSPLSHAANNASCPRDWKMDIRLKTTQQKKPALKMRGPNEVGSHDTSNYCPSRARHQCPPEYRQDTHTSCPAYLQKRTLADVNRMSAKCHKQKLWVALCCDRLFHFTDYS